MFTISKIKAREILDSRATPTIEVDVYLQSGAMGRVAVPSGASTGAHEALELRDGDKSKYLGKGVQKAISNVHTTLADALIGKEFDQTSLDNAMIALDGTEHKSNIGANAILGVSLAFAAAVAKEQNMPLYKHIAALAGNTNMVLPKPMFNIMNGGKHANWSTDIQEFMVIIENREYPEMLRAGAEIFMCLGKILEAKGLNTNIGNEGGYAPGFSSNEQAFDVISEAIAKAGYELGKDVFFALDVASTEFYDEERNVYTLKTENKELTPDEWMQVLEGWVAKYPFKSIEDPFSEDHWEMWAKFTAKHGANLQIVGDDLLVTNQQRVERAVQGGNCNALLVKVNQIGTLTETLNAMATSKAAGWNNIVSHRSGETEDVTISHIAVGTGCGQIKTGAPSRGERTAKYNELTRIYEELN